MAYTWGHEKAWFSFFGFILETLQRLQENAYFFESKPSLAAARLVQVQRADLGQWGVKWAPHGVVDRGIKVSFGQAVVRALCAAELSSSHCNPKSAWPRAKDLWERSSAPELSAARLES